MSDNRAIATRQEMEEFFNSMQFEIRYEEHISKAGNKSNNIVLYFTPFTGKYLNYVKKYTRQKVNNKRFGPGSDAIYLGLCSRKLTSAGLEFKHLHRPWYFRKKNKLRWELGTRKEIPSSPEHWNGIIERSMDEPNYRWVFPVGFRGAVHRKWAQKEETRNMVDRFYFHPTSRFWCSYVYMRRLFLLPLTLTEAARGYKVFFDIDGEWSKKQSEEQSYDASMSMGVNPRNNILVNSDGVCGYIEWINNKRFYTDNCIRGPEFISHKNPLVYKY